MKKKFRFLMFLACVAMTAGCFMLTSCGDDNDDPTPAPDPAPEAALATVRCNYQFVPTNDLKLFYDITATFTNAEGKVVTLPLENLESRVDIPADKAPAQIVFKVVGKLKESRPDLEEGKTYKLGDEHSFSVLGLGKDGKTLWTRPDSPFYMKHTNDWGANSLQKYFEKYPEREYLNYTIELPE